MQGKKIRSGALEEALNRFLGDDRRLVLGFEKDENGVRHRIFTGNLDRFSIFNPSFGVNGALYLSRLFNRAAAIVVVLRPCEIRAFTELTKLSQVVRDNITAISVDCFGTVSAKEKIRDLPTDAAGLNEYFSDPARMRFACANCRERRGVVGDAGIRLDRDGGAWAFSYTKKGEEFLATVAGDAEECGAAMLLPERAKGEKFQTGMAALTQDFSACIMCKNCRDMCPVCYCVDCVFNGDEYLPKGDALVNMIFRTGSTAMPQGKELFHLIRMFHVSQTCVGCGACEEACPQGIPLTKYFRGISDRLQSMFSYMSGRDFDETIPYVTFLENELSDAED